MAKSLDEDSARIALIDLAEAFGVLPNALDGLVNVAMQGRLFLDKDVAVYTLIRPITLAGDQGEVTAFRLRAPTAADYLKYTRGMSVTVKDGSTEIDAVKMANRTVKCVSELSDQPIGIVERISVPDLRTLQEVCDGLGFFE